MKRRAFLSFSGAAFAGGSLWMFSKTSLWEILTSEFLGGAKSVANQPPLPPIDLQSFADKQCVRCFVLGDWGTGDAFQKRVASAMRDVATKEKPQFIISTGDNFYPNGVDSPQDEQFKKHWEDMYSGESLHIPWYVVLGNHDYRKNPDAQVQYSTLNPRWNMPARYFNFIRTEGNISVEFFMLDTEMISGFKKEEIAKQLAWFEEALKKSTATWKVAVGHHMIRSHGAYGDQPVMLQRLKPLLDKYGVHLYLNGHDHDIQYLKAAEDSFSCIISGGGGGARNTSYGKNTRYAATNGGFVYLAFTENTIHAQFADAKGTIKFADDAVKK